MKKIFFLVTFITLLGITFAQESKVPIPDTRIVEAFGQETVDYLLQTSPRTIEYYNFFLDESYTISEIPQEKVHDLRDMLPFTLKNPAIGEMPDFSAEGLKKLNILRFNINIHPVMGAIYRLGNTNKIIVFYSGDEITRKFKESQNQ